MNELSYQKFSELLRTSVPGFNPIYDEHVRDNDEVLPHVLMGELVRFLVEEARLQGTESSALRAAMGLLERGMASADPMLQELIAVSFLENLDPADAGFSAIRSLFGPELEKQYRKFEKASPQRGALN